MFINLPQVDLETSVQLVSKYDFLPQLSFPQCEPLQATYKTWLLGVIITSDLNWTKHSNDITKQATKKLWVLIRFKSTTDQHSGLTKEQSQKLEVMQKNAFVIILWNQYTNYEITLNIESLDIRQTDLGEAL